MYTQYLKMIGQLTLSYEVWMFIELIRPRSVFTDINKTKKADIIMNALKSVVSLTDTRT